MASITAEVSSAESSGLTGVVPDWSAWARSSSVLLPVMAKESGYLVKMDAREIGLALVHLGGGRTRADQKIDYAVGFENFVDLNDYVSQQQPIAFVHARTNSEAEQSILNILKACVIAEEPEKNIQSNCVYDRIALDQDVEED